MNYELITEIKDYSKFKFDIDYFCQTRGELKLEEILIFLHEEKIEKTIQNIQLFDNINNLLKALLFTLIGFYEDYLRIEIQKNSLIFSNKVLEVKTLKTLLEIVKLHHPGFIDLKEEQVFDVVRLRTNVNEHKFVLKRNIKKNIKTLISLFPDYLNEIYSSEIKNIIERYKKTNILEDLL